MVEIVQPSNPLEPGDYVSSLNGETGAITLVGGTNITVIPSGQNITITSTASGGTLTRTNVPTVNTINNQAYSAEWLVFTGTSATIILTGVVAQPNGTLLYITYTGPSFLLLAQENTSSTAANRFENSGAINLKIYVGQTIQYAYDTSISRWRQVGFINTSQGNTGIMNYSDGDGNWTNDGGNFVYIPSSNRLQVTNAFVTTELDAGGFRLLPATQDGAIPFFETQSAAGFMTVDSANNLYWDNANKRLGVGTTSPSERLHVVSADNTLADPTSFTATVTPESLVNPPSSDSLSLIYGPLVSSSGSSNENFNSGSVYLASAQNWDYLVYSYRVINGVQYTSSSPLDINFIETINDGSPFTVSLTWASATNGDGSAVDGYIIFIPGLGGYVDVGNTTSFLDDGTETIGAVLTPFTGFTSGLQTFTYDLAAVGTSPSGNPYYNDNGGTNVFSITDLYGNGSLFWVSHTISGSGGGNWREVENSSAGMDGTGDQQFYETTPYSGSNTLSPQHYGILATGSSNLNSDWELYSYNGSIYSTGFLAATTLDPGDSNYYYVAFSDSTPTSEGKILQSGNMTGFNVGQFVTGTTQGYDALGPAFTDGTSIAPTSTPNSTTLLQNTSTSKTVPILILNAENTLGGVPTIAFQNNGTTQALLYSNGANVTTDGVFAASQFNGSGSGLSSLNASNISSGTLANARLGGISATIATAKLTTLGSNGSQTFVNGLLTSSTPAT